MEHNNVRKKKITPKTVSKYVFVLSILLYPLILFGIFYVGVNMNSILMAFQSFTIQGDMSWVGFDNFGAFITNVLGKNAWVNISLINSLKMYIINLVICMPLYILFSYVLFKQCLGHKVLRAIVMIPSILSGFIMCLIFKRFVTVALPSMMSVLFGKENFPNLLFDPQYSFGTNIFYMIWTSFATSLIVYPNAMKEIDDEILEAGRVDGIDNLFSELWYIVLPLIYPTISTFLITGFSAILTTSGPVATFYMYDAPLETHNMGYFYWKEVAYSSSYSGYPELAAGGLIMTVIVAPLTILLKKLLERFDYSKDI